MHIISKYFPSEKVKLIRDPIYRFIEVPYEFLPVIDDKLFQRLRWVSQLPLEQLVYPSAQHSRFEHSLGTMYLSMLVAITLLNDDISKCRIYNAINEDPNTEYLKDDMKDQFFVAATGLTGLLHDVGHAPFSHTLEDSLKYTERDINYNHEKVGYKIVAEYLINNYHNPSFSESILKDAVAKTVLGVLNKDNPIEKLTPIQKIIRTIIDSSLDVDKGDYLLRDSYHCGVSYGCYDSERLWRHVRITEDFTLGVSPKGAIEAWSLRLARYKMYKNVYKHHVRNITDALLIKILSNTFDILDSNDIDNILPINDSSAITEEILLKFSFWTDNQFLKTILELERDKYKGKLDVKPLVEKFLKRELPKRYHSIQLEKFGIIELNKDLYLKIKKAIEEINSKFIFVILENILPPVFTRDVQASIKVIDDNGEECPLAESLEFSLNKLSPMSELTPEEPDKYNEPTYSLEIFAPKNIGNEYKDNIEKKLEDVLGSL